MTVMASHTRIEGPLKVTGAAKYALDNYPAAVLHASSVGAPVAHGRVIGVDVTLASAVPGVLRILVTGDLPKMGEIKPPGAVTRPPLSDAAIEYEGQPVALVIAETLEAAEEAASLVRVSVAEAPALTPGKGKLETPPDGFVKAFETKGDWRSAIAAAAASVSEEYLQPSRHHNPMETSGTIALWEGDELTLWNTAQHNLNAPMVMAEVFGIPKEHIRQICPHTGGGFGCKGYVWPHEILTAAAAKVMGRAVRFHLSRAQQYAQVGPQPECRQKVTLGADSDGKLTAIRHEAINTTSVRDIRFEAPALASRGYYASPSIAIEQRIERIHSILPTAMRAPFEGPGSWALESAMDELAIELDIDPLDLRLASYAETEPMEGKPWSSKKLREAYAEAEAAFGWRTRRQRPLRDGHWSIGYGLGGGGMFCARNPAQARVRIRKGRAIVEVSSNDIGTGNQTAFALIVAAELGVPLGQIDIRWGDSTLPPASPVYGSTHTMSTGSAVQAAAKDARRILAIYGAAPKGPLDLEEILKRANVEEVVGMGKFVPPGNKANYNGADTPFAMQTFGVTMIEVGVDRDLGLIRLRRAVARYSAGRIINALTARSQMVGAIIWEWGKATMEASVIEPNHARFLAKNLSNVAVPVQADIPSTAIDVAFVDEFDGHASPLGVRGIGELGATGVAAAVANAVYDAVGVRVREVPILPRHILEGLTPRDG